MTAQDDPGRSRDPFDFREPPAPLDGTRPPSPDPATRSHSPFDFPDAAGGARGRGRWRRRVRAWTAELRAAGLSSPGAIVVGIAVVVVLALLVAAVVAVL